MQKTVLILGKSSPLLEHLTRLYLSGGHTVAVTSVEGDDNACESSDEVDNRLLRLQLNRRSPLSNRSCLINTLAEFESIDEAVVVHSAFGDNRPVHELPSMVVEDIIDNSIKGVFYGLKEVLSYFWKQQKGVLSMVSYTYGPDVLTPIDAAANGSFRALTDSLFTYYLNEPVTIMGFESYSPQTEEFASYIVQTIEEKSSKAKGKWFRFNDRGGFLSNIQIPGIKK